MKSLAILKDSLREAWDSKVLIVLLALSALFLVLLASIGYKPVPVQEVLERAPSELKIVAFNKGTEPISFMRNVDYQVTNFETLRDAPNPASGKYAFHILVTPNKQPLEIPTLVNENGAEQTKEPPKDKKDQPKDKKEIAKKDAPEDKNAVSPFIESVKIWNISIGDAVKLIPGKQVLGDQTKLPNMPFEVTGPLMEAFIRENLAFHYNINVSECVRKEAPLEGPQDFYVVLEGSDPRAWQHDVNLFFGSWNPKGIRESLGVIVWIIEDRVINGWGAGIAILLGIIITSFFIPEMLRKGSIDLLLSKPLNRVGLLCWKYIGGLNFMFILAVVNFGGAWLVLGIRTGIWNPKFLLAIPLVVFSFAFLYAVSTLVAVVTRNAIVAMLTTLFVAFVLYVLGQLYTTYELFSNVPGGSERIPAWVHTTAKIVHGGLPRTKDLDQIASKLTAESMTQADQHRNLLHLIRYPDWSSSILVSLIWIAVLLGLACWRFSTRDY